VGVDVEKEDTPPSRPWRLLAERFFSEAENDYLNSQPQELQYLAFLRIFTMKEAFGKAQGCGLVFPLDSFSVPLPLTEHSHRGNWEYFIRVSETNHFCLAHAVENPENIPWRYRIYGWDGKSFLAALKGQDSITEAQCDTSGRWS
jgi:phosphopantetheinyl transferase